MYIFPAHIFRPSVIKADCMPREMSGGVALSGDETTILTDGGGRWEITLSGIVLRTPHQLRIWSAWTSHMPGRAFLAPLLSMQTAPRPISGGLPLPPAPIDHDDLYFPTTVGFAGGPYINAFTVGAAPARATTITIEITGGSLIEGGEKFSVDGRAYKVERVTSTSGAQATCIISPPLRSAIPDNTSADFNWPTVQAKLVPGQDLSPAMTFGRRAEMAISFVEDFSS